MGAISSYQPFLIGQGKQSTGYFTYLDSWVKPEDAFDTLVNAYVYRGSIYQRSGLSLFPSAAGAGALVYQNNEIVATGNGGVSYMGTLLNIPALESGVITIYAYTSSGLRTSTATYVSSNPVNWTAGAGALASAGSVNFSTGAWTISTSATISNNKPIVIEYSYVPTGLSTSGGSAGTTNNPIMGITTFRNETNDSLEMLICDTKRASYWSSSASGFQPISTFSQTIYQFPNPNTYQSTNNATAILTGFPKLAPGSLTATIYNTTGGVYDSASDIPSSSTAGVWRTGVNSHITGGAIVYDNGTGNSSIIVTTNATASTLASFTVVITGSLQGDYFTGTNSAFFNYLNWAPAETDNQLYMTNNVDPVTTWDGTNLNRPFFATTIESASLLAPSGVLLPFFNNVITCLDVRVYKNRLLLFRPTLSQQGTPEFEPRGQGILYSAINQPQNMVADITGNGGEVDIPSGDWIMAAENIRDSIVVFLNESTWLLRDTQNAFAPFRIDQLNNTQSTNAPYGTVPHDLIARSIGNKGLFETDGVGCQRYDIAVIDLFEKINPNYFQQCFAQRYDPLNVIWMLYPSSSSGLSTSDQIIIYNFIENTWALFQPALGDLIQTPGTANTLSCLGLGFTTSAITWANIDLTWEEANRSWSSYLNQDQALSLLAGDQNGFVYLCNNGPTDNPGPSFTTNTIPTQIITKRFNPFANIGQSARFGYVDVYYQIDQDAIITIKFYANNSSVAIQATTFTLDGPANASYAWKRFEPNITGEFIQIEFNSQADGQDDPDPDSDPDAPFKILGIILWAMPAGRLTPGYNLL